MLAHRAGADRRQLGVDQGDCRDLLGGAIGTRVDGALNVMRIPSVLAERNFGVGITRIDVA